MSKKDDVREASSKFYAALSRMCNGEAGAVAKTWHHDAKATALHPIGGRQEGWDAIGASFDQVASLSTGGAVRIEEQLIHVGDDLAYEVGIERGSITLAGKEVAIDQRVTNVYSRDSGDWKLVHHHADISPAMLDVVAGLKVVEHS